MDLLIYTLKRIGVSIMTLLLVAAITFFLMNAIPGSPFMTEKSTPEQIALANAKYGLDKPLIVCTSFPPFLFLIATCTFHGPSPDGKRRRKSVSVGFAVSVLTGDSTSGFGYLTRQSAISSL